MERGSVMNSIQPTDRIQQLDIIRGLSLLGILIVNMISFHSPFMYYNPYDWFQYEDLTFYTWIDLLLQGSVYPIFAMLFGYGMALMYQNSLKNNRSYYKISIRRLIALMVFGMIHAFFIWAGDILIIYATMGLLLLIFMKLSGKLLMRLGVVLYFIPQLLLSGTIVLSFYLSGGTLADFDDILSLQQSKLIYSTGSFWEITTQRYYDWTINYGFLNMFVFIFTILPLMMIGAGAAKRKWIEEAAINKKPYLMLTLICLPLGILLKYIPFYVDLSISIQYVQDALGGPILGFGYVALIVLLTNYPMSQKLFRPIALIGRMSLTMYIMQSLICSIIFYHYGFGLYGEISMKTATLLAVCIFIIQVVLADIWLRKFKQGPLEWIWRKMTYGRKKYPNN